jgi:hypothetical protein
LLRSVEEQHKADIDRLRATFDQQLEERDQELDR